MKKIFLIVIFTLFLAVTLTAGSNCFEISGEFQVWNGWPPALRIHDSENKIYYGIPADDESISEEFIKRFKKGQPLSGLFCLSKIGKQTKVPYQKEPIILVKIIRYKFTD